MAAASVLGADGRRVRGSRPVSNASSSEGSSKTIGKTIGRFRILSELGRGGMGVVYLAEDPTLHRQVALKMLQAEANDTERARRFLREARAAAALSHPNIAT